MAGLIINNPVFLQSPGTLNPTQLYSIFPIYKKRRPEFETFYAKSICYAVSVHLFLFEKSVSTVIRKK